VRLRPTPGDISRGFSNEEVFVIVTVREMGVMQSEPKPAQRVSAEAGERQLTEGGIFDDVAPRAGGDFCAPTDASRLNRAASFRPSGAQSLLLQLQRRYGNRYVQRLLALARHGNGAGEVSQDVETGIEKARGGGQGLGTGIRRKMESAFGADFSGVRVHTGSEAHELNNAVNAVAFTTGQDIFFRNGAYNTESSGGRELLAHELTHVVQQGRADGLPRKVMGVEVHRMCPECEDEKKKAIQSKLAVSQPGDPHEVEAEKMARAVMESENSSPTKKEEETDERESIPAGSSRVQRQPEAPRDEEEEKKKHSSIAKSDVRSGSAGGTTLRENGTLHRQGAPPQTIAPASLSWKPPFGLDLVTTHDEAREATLAIYIRIANLNSELKKAGETDAADKLDVIAEEASARTQSLAGATPITEKEANDLTEFGKDADKADKEAIGILSRKTEEGLAPIANAAPPDTSAIEDQLAESLHDAFRKGSTDRIGELKETIEKLKKYKEKVSSTLTWAKRAAAAAKAAKTVEQLENAIGKLESAGGVLNKVSEVLTAAHAFATITGLDNKAVSSTQDAINKFQAGLDTIDLAMGFFKAVPLIGTLWSSYYMPVTKECLRLIGVIDRYQDIENRQLGLLEFWEQRSSGGRKSGQAPTIPSYLLDNFPGGQPVLDFMFAIMHDGVPQPTSAVEKYFLEHRELFNVKQESSDKLEGEGGSHWYKPWTWGDEETLKNLVPWVQRNRRTVWSMLYGSLSPDL
jgi:hypothetical protein